MLTEPIPIETWIHFRFSDPKVLVTMENWRVEPEKVQAIVISHFKEMGIYLVAPELESFMFDKMLFMIQNAPEIITILKKAEAAEARKKASRHEQT